METEEKVPYGVTLRSAGTYADYLPIGTGIFHNQDNSWYIETRDTNGDILHDGKGTNFFGALADYYKNIPHPPQMY